MNFKILYKVKIIAILIILQYSVALSQATYKSGLIPGINFNQALSSNWKINLKWESRLVISEGNWSGKPNLCFNYAFSEISAVVSKKSGLNNSFAGGYLIRVEGDKTAYTAIQQYTIVKRYDTFRLGHRFSADQTFSDYEYTEIRLRYRLAADFALNGDTVDPEEFYLKISHEYLNNFQGNSYDLEIRFVPTLGYEFTDNNKIELGLEYRVNSFIQDHLNTDVWVTINWYYARSHIL